MNDTMSLVLAATVLAIGGLGMYMYKNTEKDEKDENAEYNEDSIFGLGNVFGSKKGKKKRGGKKPKAYDDNGKDDYIEDDYIEDDYNEDDYIEDDYNKDDIIEDDEDDDDYYEAKVKSRGNKTKRNKKAGGSKRRY
jgi:hypothetical protein